MEKYKELLANKKFDEALNFLKKEDLDLPIKYYNMAYTFYEKKEPVKALVYLERAKKEGLFSEEIESAQLKIKSELGINLIESDYSIKDSVFLNSTLIKSDTLLAGAGVLVLLTIFLTHKLNKFLGAILLVPLIALCSFYYLTMNLNPVISLEEASVFRGPSRIFEEVTKVPLGAKVIYSEKNKKWKYIKYPESLRGWVYEHKAIKL
jgi:hypothetical protein